MTTTEKPQQKAVSAKMNLRQYGVPGVKVELWNLTDDKPLPYLVQGGFIGTSDRVTNHDEATVQLTVTIEQGTSLIAVSIDESTDDVTQIRPDGADGLTFIRKVKIFRTQRGNNYAVDRHTNSIRLVGFNAAGECVFWNVAIVCQNNKFFVVFQAMATGRAYIDQSKISIPEFTKAKKWKKLGLFLEAMLSEHDVFKQLSLEDISSYQLVNHRPVDGEVLFYSQRQQMGCIMTFRGEARVRFAEIQTKRQGDGLQYLLPGEIVTYEDVRRPQLRPGGKNESGFDWEVFGVEVCD